MRDVDERQTAANCERNYVLAVPNCNSLIDSWILALPEIF